MDEGDILSIKNINKKEKHKFIFTKLYRRHNQIIVLYTSLILIILFLFATIISLFLENKKLNKIVKHSFKSLHSVYYIDNNGNNLTIAKQLFHYKDDDNLGKIKKNQIHVSYSLDSKLIYPTLISMLSGLENNNKEKNILIYHLLLSYDFNKSEIYKFESLKDSYEVKINYYIIPHIFSGLKTWTKGTDCVYYKIILPLMFPDLNRIIYIDGDTLIRKDIFEMYNYSFNENYILGYPFYMPYVMDSYGINATHYINGGCLLFNIKKIREDHKDIDLLQFTIKNNSVLRFREQDSINYIFYPKIGFLPLKYGIYMIPNKSFKSLSRYTRSPLNLTEGYEAVKDPSIAHFSCCWPKVWSNGSKNLFRDDDICLRYQKEFYYYAKKTKYYSDIYNSLYFPKKVN